MAGRYNITLRESTRPGAAKGLLSARPVIAVDTVSRSRGADRPSFAPISPPERGRREDRVHAAPAVSCANAHKEHAHEHTGSAEASGLPCAMKSLLAQNVYKTMR